MIRFKLQPALVFLIEANDDESMKLGGKDCHDLINKRNATWFVGVSGYPSLNSLNFWDHGRALTLFWHGMAWPGCKLSVKQFDWIKKNQPCMAY